jgi:hypothetical protein
MATPPECPLLLKNEKREKGFTIRNPKQTHKKNPKNPKKHPKTPHKPNQITTSQ